MADRRLPAGIVLLRVEDVEDLLAEAIVVSEWATNQPGLDPEVKDCIDVMQLRVTDWLKTNRRRP